MVGEVCGRQGAYFSNEEESLILVGGGNLKDGARSDIMAYQRDTDVFQYLPGSLQTPRFQFVMSGLETEEDC